MSLQSKTKCREWMSGLELSEGAEPKRDIMLFPYGEFDHPQYGKLKFDDKFFDDIIQNYNDKIPGTQPFMDAEHDKGKALAWFSASPYKRPGLGLYIKPEWTQLGEQILKGKQYKYFSPWFEDFTDAQTGLTYKNVLRGGGATNVPFLKIMPPIIDESKGLSEVKTTRTIMLSDITESELSQTPEIKDTPKENLKYKELHMREDLIKALELDETSKDEQIIARAMDLVKEIAMLKQEMQLLKNTSTASAQLEEKVNQYQKQLTEVTTKLLVKERDEVIGKALSEGKVKPADKEYWEKRYMQDPSNIAQDLSRMNPVVQLGEIGSSAIVEEVSTEKDAGILLSEKAMKLVRETKMDYLAALKQVSADDPKLRAEYEKLYKI